MVALLEESGYARDNKNMANLNSVNNQIADLQCLLTDGCDFKEFLRLIDDLQHNALPNLTAAGYPENYAQAFLLKIANFLISKYQYQNRHEYLVASPYALIVDPANSCPLHCPGCLHNRTFQEKIGSDWPAGILSEEQYKAFIDEFGPYASTVLFYNWGEPLLNQKTPAFIKIAKSYLLNTTLSSNLSVAFDAEALVLSGLDYMIMSVDGATSATYGRYRQGGKFDLVIDNIRRLVAAKEKYNLNTPTLAWQFLLFEHNKHEIEQAKKMARELGVNEIRFAKPYEVLWEPELRPAREVKDGVHPIRQIRGNEQSFDLLANLSGFFAPKFAERWEGSIAGLDHELFRKREGKSCKWLYSTLVMDANGRYLPCCYAPRQDDSGFTYIFGNQGQDDLRPPFNSPSYRFSRKHFVWLSELTNPGGIAPRMPERQAATYCVSCPSKHSTPLVSDLHLQHYLLARDYHKILTHESIKIIADWSEK